MQDAGRAQIAQPGAAVTPWWLSGGIAAANCLAAYTPKGAASLAASYDNNAAPGNGLPDGTYDAYVVTNAPGFNTTDGWIMGRTSLQFLMTAIVTNTGYSAIGRFSDVNPITGNVIHSLFGGRNASGTQRFFVQPWRSFFGSIEHVYGYGAQFLRPLQYTSGTMALCGGNGYINGAFDYATGGAYTGGATFSIGIEGYNASSNPFGGKIQAIAVYNVTLTATQVAAVSTAMMAL